MQKTPITQETVTKVGLIIDLAYMIAVGVKKIVGLFKKKPLPATEEKEEAGAEMISQAGE